MHFVLLEGKILYFKVIGEASSVFDFGGCVHAPASIVEMTSEVATGTNLVDIL